jgi:transposase
LKDKDIIVARAEELKIAETIKKAIEKKITQSLAAEMLEISPRQVRRIAKRIKEEGISGVTHRLRGAPSKRSLSISLKEKVVSLCRQKYQDFGPTFATEKLFEIDQIKISDETLRLLLIKEGLWQAKKKRLKRKLRLRKEYRGEMVQMDGSAHFWFEDRGPRCTLMGYIDDATGRVFARFYDYEGTIPAMDSFSRYIEKYGLPLSVYFDRHSAYSSKRKLTIEEELAGMKAHTQFSRALSELKVKTIEAHFTSGQRKDRKAV